MSTQKIPIRCMFCDTDSFKEGNCQKCRKNLLPSRPTKEKLKDFAIAFGIFFLIAAIAGIMSHYGLGRYRISHPSSWEQSIIISICGFVFILLPIAFWIAFGKDSKSDKFHRRAKRHLPNFPERALLDFTKAAEEAKNLDKHFDILKEKIRLLEKLGQKKKWQDCLHSFLNTINQKIQIKGSKADISLFLKRAQIHERLENIQEALSDYERIVTIKNVWNATKLEIEVINDAKNHIKKLQKKSI